MACGRRREERQRVVEHAGWVGAMLGGRATPWAAEQYRRRGHMPDGSDQAMPYDPAVEAKVAEIQANGGKLTF